MPQPDTGCTPVLRVWAVGRAGLMCRAPNHLREDEAFAFTLKRLNINRYRPASHGEAKRASTKTGCYSAGVKELQCLFVNNLPKHKFTPTRAHRHARHLNGLHGALVEHATSWPLTGVSQHLMLLANTDQVSISVRHLGNTSSRSDGLLCMFWVSEIEACCNRKWVRKGNKVSVQ